MVKRTGGSFLTTSGPWDNDGKMVRMIATNVVGYDESSFTNFPADKYAKRLDEKEVPMNVFNPGELLMASYEGENLFPQEREEFKENIIRLVKENKPFAYKLAASQLPEPILPKEEKPADKTPEDPQAETLKILQAQNTTLTSRITQAEEERLKQDQLHTQALSKLQAEISAQGLTIASLLSEKSALQSKADFADKYLSHKRTEVKALYLKSVETPAQAMLDMIETAPEELLEGLMQQHGKTLLDKFSASCRKCGSNNISMQSSATGNEPQGEDEKPNFINHFRH